MALVCLEMDLVEGLSDVLDITVGRWTYYQPLEDYARIAFRCSKCHNYGHLKDAHTNGNERKNAVKGFLSFHNEVLKEAADQTGIQNPGQCPEIP